LISSPTIRASGDSGGAASRDLEGGDGARLQLRAEQLRAQQVIVLGRPRLDPAHQDADDLVRRIRARQVDLDLVRERMVSTLMTNLPSAFFSQSWPAGAPSAGTPFVDLSVDRPDPQPGNQELPFRGRDGLAEPDLAEPRRVLGGKLPPAELHRLGMPEGGA
jgi:hypothetical protein